MDVNYSCVYDNFHICKFLSFQMDIVIFFQYFIDFRGPQVYQFREGLNGVVALTVNFFQF